MPPSANGCSWAVSLPAPITRLLFDENLAARLVGALAEIFPDSAHVRDLGLTGTGDRTIWNYARDHGFSVVTKDEDFHRFSIVYGPPPKVIWIRLGNCSTEDIIELLRDRHQAIRSFLPDEEAAFMSLA